MKKWQIWTTLAVGAVLIAAASAGLFWWLTQEDEVTPADSIKIERTEEEKDLDLIKKDLNETEDLDTAEIDDAVKEIEAIDLSGV